MQEGRIGLKTMSGFYDYAGVDEAAYRKMSSHGRWHCFSTTARWYRLPLLGRTRPDSSEPG